MFILLAEIGIYTLLDVALNLVDLVLWCGVQSLQILV